MPRKYSRRRRSSKSSTKRRKSKKMRGGVTVKAQDLKTRLPEDMFGEIREMHPLLTPKLTNATIKRAVRDYLNGGARKQRVVTKYGEIRNWDVSNVDPECLQTLCLRSGPSTSRSTLLGTITGDLAIWRWVEMEKVRIGMTDSTFFYLSRGWG